MAPSRPLPMARASTQRRAGRRYQRLSGSSGGDDSPLKGPSKSDHTFAPGGCCDTATFRSVTVAEIMPSMVNSSAERRDSLIVFVRIYFSGAAVIPLGSLVRLSFQH